MPVEIKKTEFIATIRADFVSEKSESFDQSLMKLAEIFRELYSADTRLRAVVLILKCGDLSDESNELSELIKNCPIPVIAAVSGNVSDSGFALIEAAHLCVLASDVKFSHCEIKSAEEALRRGLINKIASADKIENEALALAERISKLAPLAIRACLKAVTKGAETSLEEGLRLESELFARMFATEDMREGTSAFLEKREAVFSGK